MPDPTVSDGATEHNAGAVAIALEKLGAAYRGDWHDFDGRSLRRELDELARALRSPETFDVAAWCRREEICPICESWIEHCHEGHTAP